MRQFLLSAVLAIAATSAQALPEYKLVDLGTLGGPGSYGAAIGANGTVVGCADVSRTAAHAFLWRNGVMSDLGVASDTNATGSSCALAVNDAGHAAGRSSTGEIVLWGDGPVVHLGLQGDVGGLNATTLVGGYQDGDFTRAFRYDSGTLTWLEPLGDANGYGMATGINGRGEIVGQSNGHAVAYIEGRVRDLGAGIAKDVNERGIIVGQGADADGQPIAMMYGEVEMPFATPPYSTAIGISNEGLVVGSGEGIGGWLLDGDTVVRLADLPAFTAAGWSRPEPTGVNDSGSIVGTATNAEGNLRAFVLVPVTLHLSKELRMVEAARPPGSP